MACFCANIVQGVVVSQVCGSTAGYTHILQDSSMQ